MLQGCAEFQAKPLVLTVRPVQADSGSQSIRPMFAKLVLLAVVPFVASCGPKSVGACFSSSYPGVNRGPELFHFPVARQGAITAWLTSDHRRKAGDWLHAPDGSGTRHRIVGEIRASDMPVGTAHDGAFLLTDTYEGPVFPLWDGQQADGRLYTGSGTGWVSVTLYQESDRCVNTWLRLPGGMKAGGWSGYPMVIGSPSQPTAVAGAMWYKSTSDPSLGGATATAMLRRWVRLLDFSSFVDRSTPTNPEADQQAASSR